MALACLVSNSCSFFTRSCRPLQQTSGPYSATEVTAANAILRIRLMGKPPLLLLRLDNRCRTSFAIASLFSKCVLKDSFGSSQKPSHLIAPCLMAKLCSPMLAIASLAAFRIFRHLLNTRIGGLAEFKFDFVVESPSDRISGDAFEIPRTLHHIVAFNHRSYIVNK